MNLINICTQHLVAIGEALQAYEKDHSDFPEWLSELHPNYLKDASILVCPADEEKGVPILPYDEDTSFPSPWLIDREGKLISYDARGTTLWQLVAEAVKKA